jgi:hypothetical protein
MVSDFTLGGVVDSLIEGDPCHHLGIEGSLVLLSLVGQSARGNRHATENTPEMVGSFTDHAAVVNDCFSQRGWGVRHRKPVHQAG